MTVTERDFDGTGMAGAHIGQVAIAALVGAANGPVFRVVASGTTAFENSGTVETDPFVRRGGECLACFLFAADNGAAINGCTFFGTSTLDVKHTLERTGNPDEFYLVLRNLFGSPLTVEWAIVGLTL